MQICPKPETIDFLLLLWMKWMGAAKRRKKLGGNRGASSCCSHKPGMLKKALKPFEPTHKHRFARRGSRQCLTLWFKGVLQNSKTMLAS